MIFSGSGAAALGTSGHRWYADRDRTIVGVIVSAGVAPSSADLIVDVLLDGATVFTVAAKPTVLQGANEGVTGAPDVTLVPAGHYLDVDVLQTGGASKVDVRVLYQ